MEKQIFTKHPLCSRSYAGHWGSSWIDIDSSLKGTVELRNIWCPFLLDILWTHIATISTDDESRVFDPIQCVLDLLESRPKALSYIPVGPGLKHAQRPVGPGREDREASEHRETQGTQTLAIHLSSYLLICLTRSFCVLLLCQVPYWVAGDTEMDQERLLHSKVQYDRKVDVQMLQFMNLLGQLPETWHVMLCQELGTSRSSSAGNDSGRSVLSCLTDVGWLALVKVTLTKLTWVVFNLPVKLSVTLAIAAIHQEKICHRDPLPPQASPRRSLGTLLLPAAKAVWSPTFRLGWPSSS